MGTIAIIKNILIMIHTNDHNPPHVTAYKGNPSSYEAKARIRIEDLVVFSSEGFSAKDLRYIVEELTLIQDELMEEWNETRPKDS